MALIYAVDKPLVVGQVHELPEIMRDHTGEAHPGQPGFVLREATFEEYVECVKQTGGNVPLAERILEYQWRWFYEISYD